MASTTLTKAQIKKIAEEKEKLEEIRKQIKIEILRPGDASNFPKKGDSLSIHYKCFLPDGTMIDNSYDRGQPIFFIYGGGHVIPGWEEVLPVISLHEIARITLPPEMAYGMKGYPPIIPPLTTLTYIIELLSFTSVGVEEAYHREKRLANS